MHDADHGYFIYKNIVCSTIKSGHDVQKTKNSHAQKQLVHTFDLMDEPLPPGHILVTDNPVEVQVVRFVTEAPLVFQERTHGGSSRRDTNTGRHKHNSVVVNAELCRCRVRSINLEDSVAIRAL